MTSIIRDSLQPVQNSPRWFAVGLLACALAMPLRAAADSTGEQSPTAFTPPQTDTTAYTNSADAMLCNDNKVAEATSNNQKETYYNYGLSVPPTAIVTGIQVRVRATDSAKNNRKLQVGLSWNGGTTFTANLNTRNFRKNAPLKDFIVGGPAVLWGHAWTPTEFANANFRVTLNARHPTPGDSIKIDCLPVTVFYRIPGAPNLTVEKTDGPDPVQPLQNITYTIAYSNTGESTATNVIVSDTTPMNTTFVSATPAAISAPSVGGMGPVMWNVGSVPPGGSGVVTLVVKVDSGVGNDTLILNDTYGIDSDQNSPTPGNTVSTTVQGTITLSLTKSDYPDPVAPGAKLTYVLTIVNNGNVASSGIMVNEAYDGNVTFSTQSSVLDCASFDPDLDQWTIASLDPNGGSCEITVETIVNSPLADGVLLFNSVDLIDGAGNTAEASAITTVHNPCGDGVVTTEECDEGAANGTPGSCCTAACTFRASGEVCRPAVGACDVDETCSGSSATCPADAKSSALCRTSAGVCDPAESCDGTNDDCPADAKSTALCRAAAGLCDLAESCDGSNNDCPADAKSSAPCRASAGVCDPAEACDGANDDCPADAKSTALCRAAAGLCDLAESCDGSNNDCPADAKSTALCRASAGVCDPAESCDGSTNDCPADAKSTTLCRAAAGVCDLAESCDGSNNDCPADAKSSAQCRASAGVCDPAESCDGANNDCPPDAKSSALCRAAAGVCDLAESCDSSNNDCPADAKSTASCRASAGACDLPENCDGSNSDCPTDAKSTAVCRASTGACDIAESCTGSNNSCPADQVQPDDTPCADLQFCNGIEKCQAGNCSPGADPCPGSGCNESTDMCVPLGCAADPEPDCRTADKSLLLIKDKSPDSKDKLIWKWIKGAPTSQAEFSDPITNATYALCIYAGATEDLVAQLLVPPSSNWSVIGTKGYKYFDAGASKTGVQKMKLKGSTVKKSKALVKGRGRNLPDLTPVMDQLLALPVRVQLVNQHDGICFEASYSTPKKDTASQFKAKQ